MHRWSVRNLRLVALSALRSSPRAVLERLVGRYVAAMASVTMLPHMTLRSALAAEVARLQGALEAAQAERGDEVDQLRAEVQASEATKTERAEELTGLQAGEAVYVRVWDAGNDQVGQFSLSFFDAEFDRDWSTDIHPVVDVTRPTIEAEINNDMIARVAPSVQVYPNPVYMADPFGNVRLSAAFEIETRVKIVISNFNGEPVRVIRRYIPADRNIEIDLNGLRGGVYFLSATSRGMSASTRLLIR